MSGEVRRRIGAAIDDHGPITFAEFMQLALYGRGGFYDDPPVGPSGDFVTSPHVHPVFGKLLGRGIRELWTLQGSPDPFRVVEVGAGDGTLARQLFDGLADLPLAYTAVEISAGARAALATIDGVQVADELPPAADLVLANELLDNLPFRVLRDGLEVRVTRLNGGFAEVLVDPDDALTAVLTETPAARGDLVVPVGAFAFIDTLGRIAPGHVLLIDYGGVGTTGGEVHGYRGHRIVGDVLRDPGTTDITSGIDFAAARRRAGEVGLAAHGPITQHDALIALGLEGWLREELARQHQQLEERAGLDAVRTWSGRSRATLLADPAGLGRLRWLMLATGGLPPPSWLRGDHTSAG